MICRYSKLKMHQFLSTNGYCVNPYLIFKVFQHMCKQEKAHFDFNYLIQKKIKSSLTYLQARWKIVGRKRIASIKYIENLSIENSEFELFLKQDNYIYIDPKPLHSVFEELKIS